MANDLRGWKEIANYLGTSERTAQRWERELGLPVRRLRNTPGATVFADRDELDTWRSSPDGVAARAVTDTDPATESPSPAVPSEQVAPAAAASTSPGVRRRTALVVVAAALVLAAISWHVYVMRFASAGTHEPGARALEGARSATPSTVVVVRLSDGQGHAFLCRVFDGGTIRYVGNGKVELGVKIGLTKNGAQAAVSELRRGPSGEEHVKVLNTLPLDRDSGAEFTHPQYTLHIEWVGLEQHSHEQVTTGDPVSDECGMSCGSVFVQALQVQSQCGTCCGAAFKGCQQP